MQVLYTYLNVPFLELKRRSLLQQARAAEETLEREYRELAGFIGGHSYGNYMQHLSTSDVDPTAGIVSDLRFAFFIRFTLSFALFTASSQSAGSARTFPSPFVVCPSSFCHTHPYPPRPPPIPNSFPPSPPWPSCPALP